MRIENKNYVYIDTKIQDKFREYLADLSTGNLKLKCVILGDSDFDYANSTDYTNSRVLNAPFNLNKVKYPLIYSGAAQGIDGYITSFARKATINGTDIQISSLYDFPSNMNWSQGSEPPLLENGNNFSSLQFDNTKMGYILYFQTLLYNYFDPDTQLIERYNEEIDIKVFFRVQQGNTWVDTQIVKPGWSVSIDNGTRDVVIDETVFTIPNNSMFLSKDASGNLSNNTNGRIELTGSETNITKKIYFNI